MSYTDRVVLLWGVQEDDDFLDKVNAVLEADEKSHFKDTRYHAISIRDSSRFVNPTIPKGRQCGCGAMMFCQSFDIEEFCKLLHDLKPRDPANIIIIWTTEHGDREDIVFVQKLSEEITYEQ